MAREHLCSVRSKVRCRLFWIPFAAIVCLLSTGPLLAQAINHPQILTAEGCGNPLPVMIGNPGDFRQFNVNLEEYKKNEAARIVKVLTTLCQTSASDRQIVNDKIDSVRLINAQGAEEPTPYIGGRVLLVEFVGGNFNEAAFRVALTRALGKGSIVKPGFDCAKATSASEHLICNEPDLATADRTLAESYADALKQVRRNPAQRRQFVMLQRVWIERRDNQCVPGKPPADEKSREAIVNCMLAQYDARIEALSNTKVTALPEAGFGTAYVNPDRNSELDFELRPDNTANFSISSGTERGVCALDSYADNPAKKTASNIYLFTDGDCKVTFELRGDQIEVDSNDACHTAYCGLHAFFDGEYTKKK